MSNRQSNSLYIGDEFLTIEGQSTKHISLVKNFANINLNKITLERPEFIGIDLETNHITGELKLLGFWEDNKYSYYLKNFLGILFNKVKSSYYSKKKLVYWNRLDPFVLYKQFLLLVEEEKRNSSLTNFGKISGEFDYKKEDFKNDKPPVVEVNIGQYRFGILNVIRSSVQFYFIHENYPTKVNKVWAYDVAGIYMKSLEEEGKRLKYYSKIDKSAHLVDWDKFDSDKKYREEIVLTSNYLDARAVTDLAYLVVDNFYKIFNYYPRSLISNGALARAGVVAGITNMNNGDKEKILEDINSINIKNYYDEWSQKLGDFKFNDMLSAISESYSGGYIEAISYGFSKTAYFSDIASAYPSKAVHLWDLRGAKITSGKGTPPDLPYSYCIIRGEIDIPDDVEFHPVTTKHFILKDTNIRAVGEKIGATYFKEEREFLLSQGATFKNEVWYNIQTKGILSPLAKVVRQFLDSRTELLAKKDSAEYIAKTCANSIYGILYEALKEYFLKNGEVTRSGYRRGEFNNDLFASYITALTRIQLSKGATAIKKAGGQIIVLMTDSIFWKGSIDMLPKEFWTEKKTLGYFEKPVEIKDVTCLGSGRYEYYTNEGKKYQGKKRGLNIVDIVSPDGIELTQFNWRDTVKEAIRNKSDTIKAKVKLLVSVGVINGNHDYNYLDLGRVIEVKRDVTLIVGHTKRIIPKFNVEDLATKLIVTKPLKIYNEDLTLPLLREKMSHKKHLTGLNKIKTSKNNYSKNYYKENKDKIKEAYREKYKLAIDSGLDSVSASALAKKSMKSVKKELNLR